METSAIIEMFTITLKPGNIYVLQHSLSRIVNDEATVNDVRVPYVDFSKVVDGYDVDMFFGTIVQALNGEWSTSRKERAKLGKPIPL